MTHDPRVLANIQPSSGIVETAGADSLHITGVGNTTMWFGADSIPLDNVLLVPHIRENLLSIFSLLKSNVHVAFTPSEVLFRLPSGRVTSFPLELADNKLVITTPTAPSQSPSAMVTSKDSPSVIHAAFGHPGRDALRRICKHLGASCKDILVSCDGCPPAKLTKAALPSVSPTPRCTLPLERLHVDILAQLSGNSTFRYALILTDEATTYLYTKPLTNKSHALPALQDFVAYAERQTNHKVKCIRTDNDSVFCSNAALDWAAAAGIGWERTVPYDSRQNGKVERANRTLRERMQACLLASKLQYGLWPEALEFSTMALNTTPSESGEIPLQAFLGVDPARITRFLQPFGCLAWTFIPLDKRKGRGGKGGPRAIPSVFLGVDLVHRGWKFWSPSASPSTFWSNSARFLPDKRWSHRKECAGWSELLDHPELFGDSDRHTADLTYSPLEIAFENDEEALQYYEPLINPQHEGVSLLDGSTFATISPATEPELFTDGDDDGTAWSRVDQTRISAMSASLNTSPTAKEALSGPQAPQWREAIRNEIEGLHAMNTFEVVDIPKDARLVDSKLVLKIKTDQQGIPVKYKARLVARGFTQRKGIDFHETFAPVAPYTAIRAVLALSLYHGWHVHSTDFSQAYLNGSLDEAIYMKAPDGHNLPAGKCYRIVTGLYGLKQSGRVWNMALDKLLRSLGFFPLQSTSCIYVRGEGALMVIIIVYVDDLLICALRIEILIAVKAALLAAFKMDDKGPVSLFCGISLVFDHERRTLSMDQHAYLDTLFDDAVAAGGRVVPYRSPITVIPDDEPFNKKLLRKYQKLVGKLLWLSINTRPDISFAVSILTRHMSNPGLSHWNTALHVVGYLKQTRHLKLVYAPQPDIPDCDMLHGFTDANWASDKTTKRRSTSGSATYLMGCLISWRTQVQKCVALSAAEAEIIAASEATRELLFFKYVLRELGYDCTPSLFTDNMACVQVAKDPVMHTKLKHVDTRVNFLRDHVQTKSLLISHISTAVNPADIFTKPLGRHLFDRHRRRFGLLLGSAAESA